MGGEARESDRPGVEVKGDWRKGKGGRQAEGRGKVKVKGVRVAEGRRLSDSVSARSQQSPLTRLVARVARLRLAASRVLMAAAKRGVSLAPRRPPRVHIVDDIDDVVPDPVRRYYGSQPGTAAARSRQCR